MDIIYYFPLCNLSNIFLYKVLKNNKNHNFHSIISREILIISFLDCGYLNDQRKDGLFKVINGEFNIVHKFPTRVR